MASLFLTAEGERIEIVLDLKTSPNTIAALIATLPARLDLHCAKIAGDQILWPTPVLLPLENPRDIQNSKPGAFIYYPKRQFLEIMFGPLQDETANVTILGQASDVAALKRLGAKVQANQGWKTTWAELSAGPDDGWRAKLPKVDAGAQSATLTKLRALRDKAWKNPPAEYARMRARRGVMLPLGPLVFAESELRKLHENLWLFRERGDAKLTAQATPMLVRGAASLLDNFLGLHDSAKDLEAFATALEGGNDDAAVLDETIRTVGRLSHWLDLDFPWVKLNAVAEEAAKAQ